MADSSNRQGISSRPEGPMRCLRGAVWRRSLHFGRDYFRLLELRIDDTMLTCVS